MKAFKLLFNNFTESLDEARLKWPSAIAFSSGRNQISFDELDEKSNQLANYLIQKGVKKGDRVGIFLNRCLENAIAIYGIWKAGGVYVPIDPYGKPERQSHFIEECQIGFLISHAVLQGYIDSLLQILSRDVTVVGIAGPNNIGWDELSSYSAIKPEINLVARDPAYIIFTSGTTGTPKGIVHSHYSGLAYAQLAMDLYSVTPEDIIASHSSLHFDISTFGYFVGPMSGAKTVIIPDAHTKMPASLARLIEQEKITIWYSVPLALSQMLRHNLLNDKDLSSLRWVLFGGEPFQMKDIHQLIDLLPAVTFSNVYGPAEVNQCTYFNFTSLGEELTAIPLGRVWDHTQALIVDDNGGEVQDGEAGELLIKSVTMMNGYYNKPELTEASLFRDGDHVYYRTGDRVRRNQNGELIFLGRGDRQIKIRGYRFELGELEYLTNMHSSIHESAALLTYDQEGEKQIVLCLVSANNNPPSTVELKEHLSQHLPMPFMPKEMLYFDALPRTTAGKIDYRVLENDIK